MEIAAYTIENENGQSLVQHECKGMGSIWKWDSLMADLYTLSDAQKLQAQHGGEIKGPAQ